MTKAVVCRCFSKYVLLKKAFRPATLLKKDSDTGFFLWNLQLFYGATPLVASDMTLKPIILCYLSLILISFQFKLYMILISLVKVNHLIYCVQEKTPKIKRLIQYVKSYLFICFFSDNMNDNDSFEGLEIAEHILNLVFCFNVSWWQAVSGLVDKWSVGRWVSRKWPVGRWVGVWWS